MQRLERLVEEIRSRPIQPTDEEVVNTIREYLQVCTLRFIFQSKFGGSLSFMGGTCLRICYDLKRYSEDLDFTLDQRGRTYRFGDMMRSLEREFKLLGFQAQTNVHEEKAVQKAFLRFGGIYSKFQLHGMSDQKIHVKVEVDTKPVLIRPPERETFFVNRYGELFPILKHTLPTLFAGKILAILSRPYARGRDYYDLIWYLSRKVSINLRYLQAGLLGKGFKKEDEVYAELQKKVSQVKPGMILKDIGRFLEDSHEANWISRYQEVFGQLRRKSG